MRATCERVAALIVMHYRAISARARGTRSKEKSAKEGRPEGGTSCCVIAGSTPNEAPVGHAIPSGIKNARGVGRFRYWPARTGAYLPQYKPSSRNVLRLEGIHDAWRSPGPRLPDDSNKRREVFRIVARCGFHNVKLCSYEFDIKTLQREALARSVCHTCVVSIIIVVHGGNILHILFI